MRLSISNRINETLTDRRLENVKIIFFGNFDLCFSIAVVIIIIIILSRTPEIGQSLGRILSCGARKSEQA